MITKMIKNKIKKAIVELLQEVSNAPKSCEIAFDQRKNEITIKFKIDLK